MPTPKRYLNERVYHALASRYVTGLQRGKARARFVLLMQRHSRIRESVEFWEQRLDPLNDQLPDRAPPIQLWERLEQQLDGNLQHASARAKDAAGHRLGASGMRVWVRNLFANLWMGGLSFSAACLLAIALFLQIHKEPVLVNYVAVLEDAQGQALWVATSSKVSRELRLDALTERLPGGEHLVLWAQSKEDGSYHAFGRVTAGGREVIALDDLAWKKIMSAQALVLSRESAANPLQPSAERVARGLCVKLNYDPVKA